MTIIYDSKAHLLYTKINQLTASVGWGNQYFETPEVLQKVLAASSHIAYIKANDDLIAFGRIVEDGKMCMFYDICVHPDHQGKGIGTELMNHLIDKIKNKNYISIGLFTWEGNETVPEFYQKLGFEASPAMALKKYHKKI